MTSTLNIKELSKILQEEPENGVENLRVLARSYEPSKESLELFANACRECMFFELLYGTLANVRYSGVEGNCSGVWDFAKGVDSD